MDRGKIEAVGELTEREKEILALVAKGLSNRQIADELNIVEGTVRQHLVHIYATVLDLNAPKGNRGWLVRWAIDHGYGV